MLSAALVMSAAAAADAQQTRQFSVEQTRAGLAIRSQADPSAIVRAELAFARLAREEGQWTGFRKTADDDAIMFVPGIVNAQRWLKKQDDPERSVDWEPERIFAACDGSYAISLGHATYPDGRNGRYVTIWRLQKKGDYRWMLDWSAPADSRADANATADSGVEGKIADCPAAAPGMEPVAGELLAREEPGHERQRRGRRKLEFARIADPPPASGAGQSQDGSLRWRWESGADGARALRVTVRYEGEDVMLVDDRIPAATS